MDRAVATEAPEQHSHQGEGSDQAKPTLAELGTIAEQAEAAGDDGKAGDAWCAVAAHYADYAPAYLRGSARLRAAERPAEALALLSDGVRALPEHMEISVARAELTAAVEGPWPGISAWCDSLSRHNWFDGWYRSLENLCDTVGDIDAVYRELEKHPDNPAVNLVLCGIALRNRQLDRALLAWRRARMLPAADAIQRRFYITSGGLLNACAERPEAVDVLAAMVQEPIPKHWELLPAIIHVATQAVTHHPDEFVSVGRVVERLAAQQPELVRDSILFGAIAIMFRCRFLTDADVRAITEGMIRAEHATLVHTVMMPTDALRPVVAEAGRERPYHLVMRAVILDYAAGKRSVGGMSPAATLGVLLLAYREDAERFRAGVLRLANRSARNGVSEEQAKEVIRHFRNPALVPLVRSTRPSGKRLRIAVCVSGQLRGYRQAFATWKALRLDEHDTRFFVHTWRNIGIKPLYRTDFARQPEGFFKAFDRITSQVAHSTLEEMYPSLHHRTVSERKSPLVRFEIDDAELRSFYGTGHVSIEDDAADDFARMSNQEKMYYKIGACHRLMRQSGETFDLVIRLRPDREVYDDSTPDWQNVLQMSRSRGMVFDDFGKCRHAFHNINTGDQFAVGTPETMACYANTYRFVIETDGQNLAWMSRDYKMHVTLALSLFYHQVDIDRLPGVRFGDLLLPRALTPAQMEQIILFDCDNTPRNWIDETLLAACREDAKLVAED